MTAEQMTAIVGYLVAAFVGGVIRHFTMPGLPSPANPSPLVKPPAGTSDHPLLALIFSQLIDAMRAGGAAISTPAMPTSPTPFAAGGAVFPQAAVNGSPASLILTVNGRQIVLPIDSSILGQPPGAAPQPAPSTAG